MFSAEVGVILSVVHFFMRRLRPPLFRIGRSLVRALKASVVGMFSAEAVVILSVVHLFIRRLRPPLFRIGRSLVRALKASVVGMFSAEAVVILSVVHLFIRRLRPPLLADASLFTPHMRSLDSFTVFVGDVVV